jgi:hypothetical protein
MDFNATIDLIIRELDEAREIIDDLKKYPDAPVMQIELAKSKCRNASEVIVLLKDLQGKFPRKQDEDAPEEATVRPSEKSIIPVGKYAQVAEHEVKTKPEQQEIPAKKPEETSQADDAKIIGQPEKKPYVAPIIADTFSHLANRFNEQISDTQNNEFSYAHGKQYSSLADTIGVNDKFYYIREIFNGNKDAYFQAITRLDMAETITEAKVVLMSFKDDKKENDAVRQLLDLVRRKFSSNE